MRIFLVRVQDTAKWHDPYVQLDLASYKLQLAYNQAFLIFKDIEDCISQEGCISSETAKILMQNLDKAFKEFNTAKSLSEFTVLLMAKSGFNNLRGNQPVIDRTGMDENPNLPVILNSDPEILDEVFEEYIKEEYLKPLYEKEDGYLLEQGKLDNLLLKNFMSELREALVDKRKSMSERESKALQRIYKNLSENALNNENTCKNDRFIPVPPPMPPHCLWTTSSSSITRDTSHKASSSCKPMSDNLSLQEEMSGFNNKKCDSVQVLRCKSISNILSTETCEKKDESLLHVPQILLETQATQYVMQLPRAFIQEEIFVGSGENSEEEIVDDNKNNENS